jgi:hypothetical protein
VRGLGPFGETDVDEACEHPLERDATFEPGERCPDAGVDTRAECEVACAAKGQLDADQLADEVVTQCGRALGDDGGREGLSAPSTDG